jgi:hypothetical protein
LAGAAVEREDSLLAFDGSRNLHVLFGGRSRQRVFEDTLIWDGRRWDGRTWKQLAADGPSETEGPALADAAGSVLLVGAPRFEANPTTVSVWKLEQSSWRRIVDTGPPIATGQAIAVDRHRGVLVWSGGAYACARPRKLELWEFVEERGWRRRFP